MVEDFLVCGESSLLSIQSPRRVINDRDPILRPLNSKAFLETVPVGELLVIRMYPAGDRSASEDLESSGFRAIDRRRLPDFMLVLFQSGDDTPTGPIFARVYDWSCDEDFRHNCSLGSCAAAMPSRTSAGALFPAKDTSNTLVYPPIARSSACSGRCCDAHDLRTEL